MPLEMKFYKHQKIIFMKKIVFYFLMIIPVYSFAQGGLGIGLKAGLNFANVTSASSINSSSQSGFMAGVFLDIQCKNEIW